MHERRSWFRRGASGGLLLGAAGGVLLALVEAAGALVRAPLAFDTLGERVRFALALVALCAGAGAIAGAAEGLIVALAHVVTAGVRQGAQAIWRARLYALALAPGVTVATAQLMSGRRAKELRGHSAITIAIGLSGILAIYIGVRIAQRIGDKISRAAAPRARRAATAAAVLLAIITISICIADWRILPRLYRAFHIGLEALAFALAQLAVWAWDLRSQHAGRERLGRFARPRAVLMILLALVTATAWSLRTFTRHSVLRAAAFAHTAVPSRLLGGAHAIGIGRGAPGPEPPLESVRPPVVPLPDGPHFPGADVLLITVDAMRADRLTPRAAPRLSALADGGARWGRAYTQVPHTSFAIATLLTGKYVYSLAQIGEDPARHETLADVFKRHRYKTAAFFPPSVFFIDNQKFIEVEKGGYHFEYVKYEYMGARGRTDQVIRFFESERPDRAFVWVHYFDPHEPYDLHPGVTVSGRAPGERSPAVDRYDGEVAFIDAEISRLIEWVRTNRERAVVAFTADHGEEFGEHGGRYHGTTLYEEQVHVPLFFVAGGNFPVAGAPRKVEGPWKFDALAPRKVAAPVGLIDVAPTLLGLADIVPSAKMRGRDLGPWMLAASGTDGASEDRLGPVFAEIGSTKLVAQNNDRLICDVAREYCELYDIAVDPGEKRNLAGREPARLAAARRALDQWMTQQSQFERAPAPPSLAAERRALERGRQGDRTVTADVARLLAAGDAALRDEAALVLLRLPPDPATRDAITKARNADIDKSDPRLDIAAYRLGDHALGDAVARAAGSGDIELRAHAALALAAARDPRAVPAACAVLPLALDEEIEKRLIAALGEARDPRATRPLLDHLDHVRTRVDTVRALGHIGDHFAAAPLARAVSGEPYVPARAEMARVLGALGDRLAAPPLVELWSRETEPQVQSELAVALWRLGAVARAGGVPVRPAASALPRPRSYKPGTTLWVVLAREDGTFSAAPAAPAASTTDFSPARPVAVLAR